MGLHKKARRDTVGSVLVALSSEKDNGSYEDVSSVSCWGGWSKNTITRFSERNLMKIKTVRYECRTYHGNNFRAVVLNLFWVVDYFGKLSMQLFFLNKYVWRICPVPGHGSHGNMLPGSPSGFTTIPCSHRGRPTPVPSPHPWQSTVQVRVLNCSAGCENFGSRTSNKPGQNFLRTVLWSEILSTWSSFLPFLLS